MAAKRGKLRKKDSYFSEKTDNIKTDRFRFLPTKTVILAQFLKYRANLFE